MHTTTIQFSDFTNRIPHKPNRAGQSGPAISSRKSPVLSRRELQHLILDMVG